MSNEDKDLKIFIPEGKKIKIGDKGFTIKPFVLKTRTIVLRVISEIFSEAFIDIDLSNVNNNAIAFKLIQAAGSRMIEIYKVVLGKETKWIEERLTLSDEIKIIKAIMEVNDFPFLLKEIQGMIKMQVKK